MRKMAAFLVAVGAVRVRLRARIRVAGRSSPGGFALAGGGACVIDGARGDAIHVIALDPVRKRGTILNILRDSWVFVPPKGGYGRINEGLFYGGVQGMVATIQGLTGFPIHYTAVTTVCGLIKLVNAIGGPPARVPRSVVGSDERYARFGGRCGPSPVTAGSRRLGGCQTLVLARDRHGAPGGDSGGPRRRASSSSPGSGGSGTWPGTPPGCSRPSGRCSGTFG